MNTKDYHVLYVDDEQANLRIFYATFKWDYTIHTALSGAEGIQILEQFPIALIITDQKMPKMTGIEFLEYAMAHYPSIPRILVTGHTEIDLVINAVNNGKIYHYITKPWDSKDVNLIIKRGIEAYQLKRSNKELIKTLESSNAQLKNTLYELDIFVYKASHDLKGPIATILGLTQLAYKEDTSQDDKLILSKVQDIAQRMDATLSKLLTINIINRENLKIDLVSLSQIIDSLITQYEGIKFEINLAFDQIEINRDIIKIILKSIIDNAVVYSKANNNDQIVINSISSENGIQIVVKDKGIGIPPEDINNIFQMFYKGTVHSQGNGLGLYIAQKAAEKIGATLNILSVEGSGTTVTCSLPYSSHPLKAHTSDENALKKPL